MKNLARRISAFLIAVIMTVSLVPVEVLAEGLDNDTPTVVNETVVQQPVEQQPAENQGVTAPTSAPVTTPTAAPTASPAVSPAVTGEPKAEVPEGEQSKEIPENAEEPKTEGTEGEEPKTEGEQTVKVPEEQVPGKELKDGACDHAGTKIKMFKYKQSPCTCTTDPIGTGELYYCTGCGTVRWSGSFTGRAPHYNTEGKPNEYTIDLANNTIKIKCSDCGGELTYNLTTGNVKEEPAVCEHDWVAGTPVPATCKEKGYTPYTCSKCSETKNDDFTDLADHTWDAGEEVPATCKEYSYTLYTCTVCEETKKENIGTEYADHTWVAGDVTKEASCTEEGEQEYTCSVCGATKTEPIPKLDHNYESTTTPATCTEDGVTIETCKVCHAQREVGDSRIPALGHDWQLQVEVVKATCGQDGLIADVCSRCNAHANELVVPASSDHHQWAAGSVITPATCTTEGSQLYVCSVCNATETRVIPTIPHTYGEPVVVEATCNSKGSVTKTCTVCGHVDTEETPINPSNHDWGEVHSTATCEEAGIETMTCNRCGITKMNPAEALGHDLDEGTVTKQPTCTETGTKVYTCERDDCGKTITEDIPKLAHNYDPNNMYKCTICGETYPEIKAIIDAIKALPAKTPEQINDTNAIAEKEEIEAIEQMIENLPADIKGAPWTAYNNDPVGSGAFTDEEAPEGYTIVAILAALKLESEELMKFITYNMQPSNDKFTIEWNDYGIDQTYPKRTPVDEFLIPSGAVLSFEIVKVSDADGPQLPVSSGTLRNADDANNNEVFKLLGVNVPEGAGDITELLRIIQEGKDYVIENNTHLPTSFTAKYTDFQTGIEHEVHYDVKYTLTFQNQNPNYIVTKAGDQDIRTTAPVTVPEGKAAILTELIDWKANIVWRDDDNRSPEGGNSTKDTPRLDADDIKEATKVYYYPTGYNLPEGYPVEGDYDYTIVKETDDDGNVTYKIKLGNLPAFNNEGDPLVYYVSQGKVPAANADVVPGNTYVPTYTNKDNFASKNNGVYNDGTISELLTNTLNFTVDKRWADGRTPEQRPDVNFYIWRITENYTEDGALDVSFYEAFAVPYCKDKYPVPKDDSSTFNFVQNIDGTYSYIFPMYDSNGCRYIYFGKEVGMPGNYTSLVDNTTSIYNSLIQGAAANTGLFLNGGNIVNTLSETNTIPLSKTYDALTLQNKMPITASFVLQKRVAGGDWEIADAREDGDGVNYPNPAPAGVIIAVNQNTGELSVTLTDFVAESMETSFNGVSANKYTGENAALTEYRWVESGLSVNGVSTTLNPANWVAQPDGSIKYNGQVVVKTGQTSPVLGDDTAKTSGSDDTTAIFEATGKSNHFTNVLVGEHQIEIRKFFQGYDADGNLVNIAADEQLKDVKVTFGIYRDNGTEPFTTVTMTQADLSLGNDYWVKLLNLDRFGDDGHEYTFKVAEIGIEGDDTEWYRTENYENKVVEYPVGSGILVKRLLTTYVNGPGPGSVLEFDIEKEWFDDSDIVSHHPVVAAVYRIAEGVGENRKLLAAPELVIDNIELGTSNNWYQKRYVPVPEGKQDSIDNYIVIEKGIMNADGTLVPSSDLIGLGSTTSLDEALDAMKSGRKQTGVVGTDAGVGDNWDGLNYKYNAFSRRNVDSTKPMLANFILTNIRIGTLDLVMEKHWKAGGNVLKGGFGVYMGDKKVADFTLHVDETTGKAIFNPNEVVWYYTSEGGAVESIVRHDDTATSTSVMYTAKLEGVPAFDCLCTVDSAAHVDEHGNFSATVRFAGISKFDDVGSLIGFSIDEIYIYDKSGNKHEVDGGTCVVDGDIYNVSKSVSSDIKPAEQHHTNDVYTAKITNARSNTYDLTSNKVWRDNGKMTRPDVCFSVYRVSTDPNNNKEGIDLAALVAANNPYALAAVLNQNYISDANRVVVDKYWDTQINNYWWTCDIENVARYDSNGYPYIYFGVEKLGNNDISDGTEVVEGLYHGYYCNDIGVFPGNPNLESDVMTTKDVFDVPNDQLAAMAGSVFVMSDGVHANDKGNYGKYYSATAVNRPEAVRTASGEKIWKLPHGWTIPAENMPTIEVDLYRTQTEYSYTKFATVAEYEKAIKDNAIGVDEDGKPTTTHDMMNHQNVGWDSSAAISYRYKFTTDSYGNKLQKYDEWGDIYYYYTLEKPEWVDVDSTQNFPHSAIIYEDNDFNITNVFVSQPPYVEVSIQKVWQLDAEVFANVQAKLAEYGLVGLKDIDFVPATIKLTGVPTDGTDEISGAVMDFGEITLKPGEEGSGVVIDSLNKTLTVTYTFVDFLNDNTGKRERLPYYWLDEDEIDYYVQETSNNGYVIEVNGEPQTGKVRVTFTGKKTVKVDGEDAIVWTNLNTNTVDGQQQSIPNLGITNKYNGDKKNFDFTKTWADKYVDNDAYRPDAIDFVIKRYEAGSDAAHADTGFSTTVRLYKSDFTGMDVWSSKAIETKTERADEIAKIRDLLKYAPSSKEYMYFVYSETFLAAKGDGTYEEIGTAAINVGDTAGQYELTLKTNTNLLNRLVDNERVSLAANKVWTVEGSSIASFKDFKDYIALGVFPRKIEFYVQRREAGTQNAFANVPSSVVPDSIHKIGNYLGREVVFSDASGNMNTAITEDNYLLYIATKVEWENLPRYIDAAKTKEYEYRVFEQVTWFDSSVSNSDNLEGAAARGLTIKVTDDTETGTTKYAYTLNNEIGPKTAKLQKIWDDNHGAQNIRPDKIRMTVKPILNGQAYGDGFVYTLTAKGHAMADDANIYESDPFKLPQGVPTDSTLVIEAGKQYLVSEVFLKEDGTEYTQAELDALNIKHTPSIVTAAAGTDGVIAFQLTNTERPDRKLVSFEASKVWSGDTNWAAVVRPTIQFQLQYKDRATGSWVDVTDANKNIVTEDTTLVGKQIVDSDTSWKAVWDKLYKYWDDSLSQDGVAEPIVYQVVEIMVDKNGNPITDSSYNVSYSVVSKDGKDVETTTKYSETVTNTYKDANIGIKKVWTKNGTSEQFSQGDIQTLINLNRIPLTLTFKAQYKIEGTEDWVDISTSGGVVTKTFETLKFFTNGTQNFGKVPRYDKDGNQISYRIVEIKLTFNDNTTKDVNWTGDAGAAGSITTAPAAAIWGTNSTTGTVSNDYAYVEKEATKTWYDEKDRDGLRKNVTLDLMQNDEVYSEVSTEQNVSTKFFTVTKNGDVWTVLWKYLPKYDDSREEYTYTVQEKADASSKYDVTYPDEYVSKVENNYQPLRGKVIAQKSWTGDYDDYYGTRPAAIYLRIDYKVDGDWAPVVHNELGTVINGKYFYNNADPAVAYTTSLDGWIKVNVSADKTWPTVTWENLPVYAKSGKTVTYRVIEGKLVGNEVVPIDPNGTLNGYKVTYTDVTLSKDNDSKTDTVTNDYQKTSITVQKKWTNEDKFAQFVRPDSVTFKITFNKVDAAGKYMFDNWKSIDPSGKDYELVITGSNTVDTWSKSIDNLPKIDADGNRYVYRAEETKITYPGNDAVDVKGTKVGPYDITTATVETAPGVFTVSQENVMKTGSITVTKYWHDNEERDNGRVDSIYVALYRDGVKIDVQQITKANNWTYTWNNILPVRTNKGNTFSVYTVDETDANGNPIESFNGANGIKYNVTVGSETTLEGSTPATSITNTFEPKLLNFDATKIWEGESAYDVLNVRPDSIRFTLQYKVGDGEWTNFPEAPANRISAADLAVATDNTVVYMVSDNGQFDASTQTLNKDNSWKAEWHGLVADVKDADGNMLLVQYRAVEEVLEDGNAKDAPNYKAGSNGESGSVNYDSDSKSVSITNTLEKGSITVSKTFKTKDGKVIPAEKLAELIEKGVLPATLPLVLSYRNGADLVVVDNTKSLVWNATAKAYTAVTYTDLPIKNAAGEAITYVVTDDNGSFDFIECGSTDVKLDQKTSENATVTNTYEAGSIKVTKNWVDNEDRDGGRKEITVILYRDGAEISRAVLNAANNWTYQWNDLPVKRADGTTNAVYTVKEDGEARGIFIGNRDMEYSVVYSDGVTLEGKTEAAPAETTITNTHDLLKFNIKALKKWDDVDYGIRPEVTFALYWTIDETVAGAADPDKADWNAVVKSADAPYDADGTTVTTTSDIQQTLNYPTKDGKPVIGEEIWSAATWDNLPAYVIGADGASHLVYYKVFEVGTIPAPYTPSHSATVTYETARDTAEPLYVKVNVLNTLTGKTAVEVQKLWNDEEIKGFDRPESITVKLQYSTNKANPTEWQDITVDGTKVLTASTTPAWYGSWENLRNDYAYRVVEVSMTYANADGSKTTYEAKPIGTEGEIGGYKYKLETKTNADNTMVTCTIDNTPITGEIEVTKTWNDGHDRDGLRPKTLVFKVLRDGVEYTKKTVNVDENGQIYEIIDGVRRDGCKFTNLPVYKSGSRELSEYSVTEAYTDATTAKEYKVRYSISGTVKIAEVSGDVTTPKTDVKQDVTNIHNPKLFTVQATKNWVDNENYYGLRPTKVKFRLQYAFSPDAATWTDVTKVDKVPTAAEDTGTLVFTTSDIEQTLTSKDAIDSKTWGTAKWENLPAYALKDGKSTKVYYRVVEEKLDTKTYSTENSAAVSIDNAKADGTATVATAKVTNTLEDVVKLTVKKTWTGKYDKNYKVVVQLQYRVNGGEWQDVPQNGEVTLDRDNGWTHTFTGLRADYEYRCIETAIIIGTRTYKVKYTTDKDFIVEGRGQSYKVKGETTVSLDADGNAVYSTTINNKYTESPKTGDSFNGVIYGTALGGSGLGIAGVIAYLKRKKKDEEA